MINCIWCMLVQVGQEITNKPNTRVTLTWHQHLWGLYCEAKASLRTLFNLHHIARSFYTLSVFYLWCQLCPVLMLRKSQTTYLAKHGLQTILSIVFFLLLFFNLKADQELKGGSLAYAFHRSLMDILLLTVMCLVISFLPNRLMERKCTAWCDDFESRLRLLENCNRYHDSLF